MPLRKSPRRTRALLAANRRNSRKSTGPRTATGKRQSAWNAIRHGRRARHSCRRIPVARRELKAFMDFYCKLSDAIIPADSLAGEQAVLTKALEAWKVKRILDRWIETRTEEDWLVLAAGAAPLPSFWRLRLRRPGVSVPDWTVTISVWLRWGRGPGQTGGLSARSAADDNDRVDRPRMHTMVSVHSTGPFRRAEAREGPPSEAEYERTKPESTTMQSGSENMSVPADWDPSYAEAYALAERIVGWFMGWRKRTKPECDRKRAGYKNMSPAGERGGENPNGNSGARSLGKAFRAIKAALVPRKEYSQLPLFQTKPECSRNEAAYKNMSNGVSKTGDWLGTAASFLLKGHRVEDFHAEFTQPKCPVQQQEVLERVERLRMEMP
jgi:hypothetical protein